jgi:hypothetical protein
MTPELSVETRNFGITILGVFLRPPPHLERENFIRNVELMIPEVPNLSILKKGCENYLFEDYHLKSGILIWILTLKTTGRSPQEKSSR